MAAAAKEPFVHLHLHTEYSTLDGAVRIKDLMAKCVRYGMPAVAMTDHGNLYGAIEFYEAAVAAGIKPIIGCEIYLAPGSMFEKKDLPGHKRSYHLTLLAKNATGYSNLVKLVSKAHLDGKYYKPRIDKEHLKKWSEGIICLSGCITGEVNHHIQNDQLDKARESIRSFIDIYGKDDFYLEIHDHGMGAQQKCKAQLIKFAKEFGLKLVAANDVHFLNKSDHETHDVMICIGTNANVFDENRMHYSEEVYLKTGAEMKKLFKDVPEAVTNTLEIADKVDFELVLDAESTARYPQFDAPDGSPREEYFRKVCYEGLEKRYGDRAETDPELKERLDYEIGIMEKMGFISYFLITWDFIKWAKDHKIPVGPGRGSAAGSLVAYVLEITDLCPIRFGLIFERFLNPERVSPPDIDVDFCQSRRGEVIEYVREKYGERSVSHIITFGTLGAKSVVRDVGRVMGMSYGDGDRIAKMIPTELGITLAKARQKNPELKAAIENEPATGEMWKHATFLEGLTRGVGIHAAGIVIGDCELDVHVPLTRGNDGEVVTQYAMGPLTELGMLKMDFLGLKTLTVIQDAVDLIHRNVAEFEIGDVPLDDKKTFELLNAGETCGVFQLESGGMVNLCRQFGVDRIEDIIALIALYRPGPMDLIPDYIDRKKGKKKVDYLHPLLEEVSRETYGILIYQEQVQRAANVLAGYSLGEADLLRRAMGKKKVSEMVKQREKFVKGCKEVNNIPEKKANAIFDLLEKFAGYGFNKSHSAAYGLISYHTAYLKANYPVEFMSALLSNEINNTDKISIFVAECQRMGIEIQPPDVNESQLKFAPAPGCATGEGEGEKKVIRFGLAAVKNVGEGAMEAAVAEREQGGVFASLEEFANRLDTKVVNKKILESLIKAGAFSFTNERRAELFGRVERVVSSAQAEQRDRKAGQGSLFDTMELSAAPPVPEVHADPDKAVNWSKEDLLGFEKDLLGFYVTGHPLDAFRAIVEDPKNKRIGELDALREGAKYRFAGLISVMDVKYTKREGKAFAVVVVEDFSGSSEMIVWNDVFAEHAGTLAKGMVILMRAKVEVDSRSESRRLTADKLRVVSMAEAVKKAEAAGTNGNGNGDGLTLTLGCADTTEADLLEIRDVVRDFPGEEPLRLAMKTAEGTQVTLVASGEYGVKREPELLEKLGKWL